MTTTAPHELSPALIGRLRTRYAEAHRHYHSQAHIDALLRWLGVHEALAVDKPVLEAAVWFHDAIYDTRRNDNELQSAELARSELQAEGWASDDIERVAALVIATQHHQADPQDTDAWLFLDLDLSVLAAEPHVYDTYSAAIRAEFSWVPQADYQRGRAAVLASFQTREHIYRTPQLKAEWEPRARANLVRELSALQALPG